MPTIDNYTNNYGSKRRGSGKRRANSNDRVRVHIKIYTRPVPPQQVHGSPGAEPLIFNT
jgi:hypothetical protein